MSQQQRRMFRGRGGATDRQLPKHSARRRKQVKDDSDQVRVKYDTPAPNALQHVDLQQVVPSDELDDANMLDNASMNDGETMKENSGDRLQDTIADPARQEAQHLLRRIRNVRESMQLSDSAANLSVYQNNVLHAVTNCIVEWRAILRFHANDSAIEDSAQVGLQVFEMLQQALQCGPLAGGKPGYFKRCGADVARIVLAFLQENVGDTDDALYLHQSEKQANTVQKWKVAAAKAIEADKPPSKSVLKKQGKATKKKKG
jgi:hypothetical protein